MKPHYTRLQRLIRRALSAVIRIERYYQQHPEAVEAAEKEGKEVWITIK